MAESRYHLAQINVAWALASLNDPLMADFVAQLDAINAIAEQSPGFVWRLKTADGGASSYIRAFEDERMLINMSVWDSLEVLQQYVYRSQHGSVFRDRRKWFEPLASPSVTLWWIRAGLLPTAAEGRERLEALARNGPTPYAFTFKQPFPPPSEPSETKT